VHSLAAAADGDNGLCLRPVALETPKGEVTMPKSAWGLLAALLPCLLLPAWAAEAPARFSIRQGDRYGAIDAGGKVVIEPQYDAELRFADGLAVAAVGSKVGVIDLDGKLVISPQAKVGIGSGEFAQEVSLASLIAGDFAEGLAPFRMGRKLGYLDRSGAVVVPPQFDQVEAFAEGQALVAQGGRWGSIDRSGKWVIEPQFDKPFRFREGLAAVLVSGKGFGYIDRKGQFVIPAQYNYAYNFSGDRARVQLRDGYGYIDRQGKVVVEPSKEYRIGADYSDARAPARAGDKGWGYLDPQGGFAVAPQFFSAREFSEGRAAVAVGDFRNHQWGYIDAAGKPAGAARFQQAEPFSEGRAAVLVPRAGYGYVDAAGELVIGPLEGVTQVEPFQGGLARVWFSQVIGRDGRWGYIDRDGKLVWKAEP